MKHSYLLLIAVAALVSACSSSSRPVYSGHQESTDGVPGFVNGKKVSPHVKLGQSYTVDGDTYVPRNQPDYVEVGMASWYGPGFHGGKTANGEEFDTNALTAAHRTLPLPSIVRVTMISTGKQAYVRVNDRGPFAHSRIIDLSRGAAEKIGLLRAGVAKVRVEYMKAESQRFADLLAQGRDPRSIDIASEVLNYDQQPTQFARADTRVSDAAPSDANQQGFWNKVTPISSAHAAEPQEVSNVTESAAPVSDVVTNDLPAQKTAGKPMQLAAAPAPVQATAQPASEQPADNHENAATESPFAVLETSAGGNTESPQEVQMASLPPKDNPPPERPTAGLPPTATAGRMYVQIGAFQSQENAERLRKQYGAINELRIIPKQNASGQTLYHVRMGPYATNEASYKAVDALKHAGADPKIIRE